MFSCCFSSACLLAKVLCCIKSFSALQFIPQFTARKLRPNSHLTVDEKQLKWYKNTQLLPFHKIRKLQFYFFTFKTKKNRLVSLKFQIWCSRHFRLKSLGSYYLFYNWLTMGMVVSAAVSGVPIIETLEQPLPPSKRSSKAATKAAPKAKEITSSNKGSSGPKRAPLKPKAPQNQKTKKPIEKTEQKAAVKSRPKAGPKAGPGSAGTKSSSALTSSSNKSTGRGKRK